MANSVIPAVGGSSNLSLVLLSLAEILGFCPVHARFRGSAGEEFTHRTWDSPLVLFFLSSHYLWLVWALSSGSSGQKA